MSVDGPPVRVGEVAADMVEQVRDRIARDGATLTPAVVAAALRDAGRPVGDATVLSVLEVLRRDVVGAGPLEHLLRLDGVTDVLVNGAHAVYVDRGQGLELTSVRFADDAAVRRLAQRLTAGVGRRLDDASSYVDVRLRDGTRLHAVLAPLARPGTLLSLRVPRRRAFTLAELEAAGTVPPEGTRILREVVESRLAFVVTGGTGSGKSTLLNALLSHVDPADRMVIVEDTSELRPTHPHVVALESRPANAEGAGHVDLRTLVRQALRMRPDRLVVGEVRGAEVVDLLAALNTGHEGGCATVHANSASDAVPRLEGLALAAGMTLAAVHSQLGAALDVVVHCVRDGRSSARRGTEVSGVGRAADGIVTVSPAGGVDGDGGLREDEAAAPPARGRRPPRPR